MFGLSSEIKLPQILAFFLILGWSLLSLSNFKFLGVNIIMCASLSLFAFMKRFDPELDFVLRTAALTIMSPLLAVAFPDFAVYSIFSCFMSLPYLLGTQKRDNAFTIFTIANVIGYALGVGYHITYHRNFENEKVNFFLLCSGLTITNLLLASKEFC